MIHHRVMEAAKVLQLEEILTETVRHLADSVSASHSAGDGQKTTGLLNGRTALQLDAKLREQMRIELVRLHKRLETTRSTSPTTRPCDDDADRNVLPIRARFNKTALPPIYNRPANLFVAKFIGSPTINIFHGKIDHDLFTSDSGQVKIR